MIYTLELSAEHVDLVMRALGTVQYNQVCEVMDAIRLQIHQQHAEHLARMEAVVEQGIKQQKKGHANGVSLEGKEEVEIVEVGAVN